MKTCNETGRFVIEDLDNPEVTSRWSYSCGKHLGTTVKNVLKGTTQVRVHGNCDPHTICEYGVE